MSFVSTLYWTGACDGVNDELEVNDELRVSFPWRLDSEKRPYLIGNLPTDALTAERLHNDEIQSNAEWRANCANEYQDIPFLNRFFGGTITTWQKEGRN